MELKDLRFFQYLEKKDAKLAVQLETIYSVTKETINSISGCYNNYTMHDMGHGLRVASYMEELSCGLEDSFNEKLEKFNAFEIALMLLSSILHDIGMFIRPEDSENIRQNKIPYTNSLTFSGVLKTVNNSETEAIKEIVRITHAKRIEEFIDYDFNGRTIANILMLDDKYCYADDIVKICVAHGENYDYLNELRTHCTKGSYTYNPRYIAALLRIADYLDLDKQRTPILWYKMMRLDGFSRDEWEKHFVVHNEKKFKKYVGNKLQLFFEGKSSNAKIHRRYLAYVDDLKTEIENADMLLNNGDAEDKYWFCISTKIDDRVVTEGFRYSDLRLNLDYSSITELLMGNNIYGNNRLGLRELIQNSIDACQLMKEIQYKSTEEDIIPPQISILISKEKGYVKIRDTGIGMTIEIVKKHFLNVGKSYYKSNEFAYENYKYNPIGHFGIGFLACFLLSDNVTVKTKYYRSNEIHQIELEKNSEYVVTNTEETPSFYGTEITLDYDKFFDIFSGIEELKDFIQMYFLTDIPIIVKDVDQKKEIGRSLFCSNLLLSRIDKDSASVKYEDVACLEFSNVLDGTIRLKDLSRRSAFQVHCISADTIYLYDKKEQKFKQLLSAESLPDSTYRLIRYAKITPDEYHRISSSRKGAKNKRAAILALSSSVILLCQDELDLGYNHFLNEDGHIMLQGQKISDILLRSGFDYYEEFFDAWDCIKKIFVQKGMYFFIEDNFLNASSGYSYKDYSDVDALFYNKGIWVKDLLGIVCSLPFEAEIKAVINYLQNGIKLDVSRNNVIAGRHRINVDVTETILKYCIVRETDPQRKSLLTSYMQYITFDPHSKNQINF